MNDFIKLNEIEHQIYIIRGQKVMIDKDIAELYGVSTKRLNEQVRRNIERFPEDFMFQLTLYEAKNLLPLRSQIATLKRGQHIKYAPYAFTEHGAVMLASLLNSPVAISASLQVVRAFVRLRSILAAHKELARQLDALSIETKATFAVVFDLIEKYIEPEPVLEAPEQSSNPEFGFRTK